MNQSKISVRREWWEIIESVPRVGDREKLSRALIGRLFGVSPCLPDGLKPIFGAIEREIRFSEKQRQNGCKRWNVPQSGIMPSTEPTTEPSTEPSTEPTTGDQGARTPACVPGRARGNLKPKKESLSKEREKKKGPFYPSLPGLKGEYCCSLPQPYQVKWDEWESYYHERTRRKMPPTTAAAQIKKLLQYSPEEMAKVIDYSIGNGYQGLFPDRALGKTVVVLQARKDNSGI